MLTNNTIYRLLPVQIVPFWNAIKYACVQADEVKKEDLGNYFNELLQALLSEKAQCFIVLDDQRILHSIAITRIITDKVQFRKELYIQCLYSMSAWDDESTRKYFSFVAQFAAQEECKAVTFSSRNSRIWEIARVTGCVERHRTFAYNLGR